jgi:uncharacterized protein YaaN involved in tellurite resistance
MKETTPNTNSEIVPTDPSATEIVALELIPKRPNLSEEEILKIESDVDTLIQEVIENADTRTVLRRFDNLGDQEQELLTHEVTFLQTRINNDLDQAVNQSGPTPKNLNELSVKMDSLNPGKIKNEKIWGFLPRSAKNVINQLATRYKSGESIIDGIIKNLDEGKETLVKDGIQLEQLALNIDKAREQVLARAYLGELLIKGIEKALPDVTHEVKKNNIEKLRHRIYMRVQDLRITEQLDLQFQAAISTMLDNNDQLIDAVKRTINVARPLLTVIISLSAARQNQKAVAAAVQTTRDSIGDMLVAGAQEQKDAAEQTAKLANSPVIQLEKVEEAYKLYLDAMETSKKLETEGIENAQKTIARVNEMSTDMEVKTLQFKKENTLEVIED